MATSSVEIVNRALHKVDSDAIESLTEDGTEAELARLLLAECRQFVLKRGRWGWALKRAKLAQLTISDTNTTEYDYLYGLPGDLIKPLDFTVDASGRSRLRDYRITADGVECAYTELYCRYVFDQTDPNKMSVDFRVALEDYLAYRFALSLPGSRSLSGDHLDRFERVSLPRALAAEGIEDGEHAIPDSEWVTSRYVGSGWA